LVVWLVINSKLLSPFLSLESIFSLFVGCCSGVCNETGCVCTFPYTGELCETGFVTVVSGGYQLFSVSDISLLFILGFSFVLNFFYSYYPSSTSSLHQSQRQKIY
jgi:hypothetical protein